MNWINLDSFEGIAQIVQRSSEIPCLLFKHSNRCTISYMVKYRLENGWDLSSKAIEVYFLDLIRYRDVSENIESVFNVRHESPQVLLIENGKCIFHTSHLDISFEKIKSSLTTVAN